MMTTKNVSKGRTTTTVAIVDVTTETNDEILDLACAAARESRLSLFGWDVNVIDTEATVYLYTD